MNLVRSTSMMFVSQMTNVALTFLVVLYFARTLGTSGLGTFFLFQALATVLSLPANMGTRISIQKRLSEGYRPEQILATGFLFKLILLSIVVLGILAFRDVINGYLGADLTFHLAVAVVFQEATMTMINVLRGELRVSESALLELTYTVIWTSVGAALVALGFGVLGAVYAVIIGYVIAFLWGVVKYDTSLGRPDMDAARSLYHYAKFAFITEIDNEVYNWMDVLIIGLFLTTAAVGAYEVAWRITMPVGLITIAIALSIFPQVSAWEASGAMDAVENLIPKVIMPALVLVFPAFFGGLLFSGEILGLLFGPEFTIASLALIILLAGQIPSALSRIAGHTLTGINRPDLVTRAAIVDTTLNIVLNIVLILQFGIVGAAIATSVALTVGTGIRIHYLNHFITIRVPLRKVGWCFLSSIMMFLALLGLRATVEIHTLPRLIAAIGLGAVLYGVFLVLYSPLRAQLVTQIRSLLPT